MSALVGSESSPFCFRGHDPGVHVRPQDKQCFPPVPTPPALVPAPLLSGRKPTLIFPVFLPVPNTVPLPQSILFSTVFQTLFRQFA